MIKRPSAKLGYRSEVEVQKRTKTLLKENADTAANKSRRDLNAHEGAQVTPFIT